MRRVVLLAVAGLVAAGSAAAAPAAQQRPADPHFEVDLELGDAEQVAGENAGVNPWNFVAGDDYHCEETPHERCQVVLVKVTNPYEEENAKKGRERANLLLGVNSSIPPAINDFALRVYESDESGAPGELVGSADNSAGDVQTGGGYNEEMTVVVTSTEDEVEFFYRVEVIFWSAAGDWWLDMEFTQ